MFEDDSPADPKMLLFWHMGNPWEIPSGNPGPHVSGKKIHMSPGEIPCFVDNIAGQVDFSVV